MISESEFQLTWSRQLCIYTCVCVCVCVCVWLTCMYVVTQFFLLYLAYTALQHEGRLLWFGLCLLLSLTSLHVQIWECVCVCVCVCVWVFV